jgi:radical SAM superfamily enzyme YgiQ (UPF0313 family)
LKPVAEAAKRGELSSVRRIFLADGDALGMPTAALVELLVGLGELFPNLTRISCYATARNLLGKELPELRALRELGLSMLYVGPESGDDETLRAIAKGSTYSDHVEAGIRAKKADFTLSLIFLLGIAGRDRGLVHAEASGRLTTEMNPRYVSLLTTTVVPGTPLALLARRGRYEVPEVDGLLREIGAFLKAAEPENAVFRSNHASNYLPLSGRLSRDRERLLGEVESALAGKVRLTPEWLRRL